MNRFAHCLLLSLALCVSSVGWSAPQAQAFTRYDRCSYISQQPNDSGFFHVRMPDWKGQVLTLYFVDCPESENTFPERVAQQAAYFGVSPERSLEIGKLATEFTKSALSKPFSVQTRWRVAGRSKLPRFYAFISTAGGEDLGELLVSNGLACIYGTGTPLADVEDSRTYLARLAKLEAEAKQKQLGGWKRTP